jgi:hypothetical protein
MTEVKVIANKERIFLDISSVFMSAAISLCQFYSTFSPFFFTEFSSDNFLEHLRARR